MKNQKIRLISTLGGFVYLLALAFLPTARECTTQVFSLPFRPAPIASTRPAPPGDLGIWGIRVLLKYQ